MTRNVEVHSNAGTKKFIVDLSVLEQIKLEEIQHLSEFTLGTVVAEVKRWSQTGRSRFIELAESLDLKSPERPILDAVLPV